MTIQLLRTFRAFASKPAAQEKTARAHALKLSSPLWGRECLKRGRLIDRKSQGILANCRWRSLFIDLSQQTGIESMSCASFSMRVLATPVDLRPAPQSQPPPLPGFDATYTAQSRARLLRCWRVSPHPCLIGANPLGCPAPRLPGWISQTSGGDCPSRGRPHRIRKAEAFRSWGSRWQSD